jgi:hypothetical protein
MVHLMTAIRILKDDRGLTFVERGLQNYSRPKRNVIILLATYAYLQLAVILVGDAPLFFNLSYEAQWSAELPGHLVNGMCDIPGREGDPSASGTRYGPPWQPGLPFSRAYFESAW